MEQPLEKQLAWLMGGNSTRVLALPEGLSFGPIPPGVHLADGKCKSWPTSAASPCTQDRTRTPGRSPPLHTFPPAPPGSTEASLGRQPNALFLSSLSWKSCLFSVSPPPHLPVTVSVPVVWLPAAHTPGTSLVKVTVPSVPLTGFTLSRGLPAALEKADHFPSCAFFQPGSQGCAQA